MSNVQVESGGRGQGRGSGQAQREPWHKSTPAFVLLLALAIAGLIALAVLAGPLRHFVIGAAFGLFGALLARGTPLDERWKPGAKALAGGAALTLLSWWAVPDRLLYSDYRLFHYDVEDYFLVVASIALLVGGALVSAWNGVEWLLYGARGARPSGGEDGADGAALRAYRARRAAPAEAPALTTDWKPASGSTIDPVLAEHAAAPPSAAELATQKALFGDQPPATLQRPLHRDPPIDWTFKEPPTEQDLDGPHFGLEILLFIPGLVCLWELPMPWRHWITCALFGAMLASALLRFAGHRWATRRFSWICVAAGSAALGALWAYLPPGALLSYNRLREMDGAGLFADFTLAAGSLLCCGLLLLLWRALGKARRASRG